MNLIHHRHGLFLLEQFCLKSYSIALRLFNKSKHAFLKLKLNIILIFHRNYLTSDYFKLHTEML